MSYQMPDLINETLEVLPLSPRIGAELRGVALSGNLTPPVIKRIADSILQYKVVFFRNQQHLTDKDQRAFGRLLGPIEPHPLQSNADEADSPVDVDGKYTRASAWHTDVTFIPAFPQFTILFGVVIPPVGGDTVWANTAAAYEGLPQPLRTLADTLWGHFSNVYDYAGVRETQSAERERYYDNVVLSKVYKTDHPIVQLHPHTAERALILGNHLRRFVGLNTADSFRLASIFQDHITKPENVVRWRWAPGDLVIWDNRATQHKAVDDYGEEARILRRLAISGAVSQGIDGRRGIART